MITYDSPLDNIKIASPCPANWDAMNGNDKVRFCAECKLNVYNLSGMNKFEAEDLLRSTEGRLCVRYFRRADGTILTQDCPVGWRALKKRVSNLAAAACTLVLGIMGTLMFTAPNDSGRHTVGVLEPVLTTPTPEVLMGNIAYKPTPIREMGAIAGRYVKEDKEEYPDVIDDNEIVNKAVRKFSRKKVS